MLHPGVEAAELLSDQFRLEVRVSKKQPGVTMSTYKRHLSKAEACFKKPADRLVPQVVISEV